MSFVLIIVADDNKGSAKESETTDPFEPLWDAERVAEYLSCDDTTVYELARTGKLPSVQLSERRVRFDPPVIRQWVKNGGKLDKELRLVKG